MDNTNWEHHLERYLTGSMLPAEVEAFEQALEDHPEREAEVELRQLEQRAIDRFYEYTKDKPESFPESFPGTKLYFASLFTTTLFMGTYTARTRPTTDRNPTARTDDQQPPHSSEATD